LESPPGTLSLWAAFYQEPGNGNAEPHHNKRMIMLGLTKSLIFVVGLIIFTAYLIMAFEPPANKETLLAIENESTYAAILG
jgi:flagellar biogenesis protein FliO